MKQQFKINKKKKEAILNFISIIALTFILGFMLLQIFVPLTLGLLEWGKLAYLQYSQIKPEFKFFGTVIIIYLIWYIFGILAKWFSEILFTTLETTNKFMKFIKK